MNKDTIYVDVDDEITAIIDKVHSSKEKIVALVLPKRAAMLQSIVNMKLLKRTADQTKKRVVLITSEAGLQPLAGAVGLHVAKTLQSRPYVPEPPEIPLATSGIDEEVVSDSQEIDRTKPIGVLAGFPASEDDTTEVNGADTTSKAGSAAAAATAAKGGIAVKAAKVIKDRKLKVPNFGKFRTRLILAGALLVLLIIAWVFAFMVMPKATITVETDAASVTSTLQISANTAAKELDKEAMIVPATLEELKKTDTEKVPATGEVDKGTKASGTVSLKNCEQVDGPITIPAGTGVSANNLTFITQDTVTLPQAVVTAGSSKTCVTSPKDVDVTAQKAGDDYNLASGTSYSVAGYSDVRGTGTAMTGGTSEIVKVISQADIDTAKEKISARASSAVTEELQQILDEKGLYGIDDTFISSEPAITTTPKAGDEAADVTVTAVTTHSMLGIKEDDLKALVEDDIKQQIDTERQSILDNGLADAAIRVIDRPSPTNIKLSVQAVGLAGPEIDVDALKEQVVGKRRGEVVQIIEDHPGVKDVTVEYSPFWITTTPKKAAKITIEIKEPPRPEPVAEDAADGDAADSENSGDDEPQADEQP